MGWINYNNTQAVGLKLKHDITLITHITDIAIQAFFVCYYLFQAIAKRDRLVTHLIYVLFLFVAIGYLIFHILSEKKLKRKIRAKVRRTISYCKYPLRTGLLIYTLVDILLNGASDLSIIMYALSVIAFFIQILIQVLMHFIRYYVDLFSESLKMDYDQSLLIKSAVNSYRYPKPKERFRASSIIIEKAKNGINDFIDANKDSAPVEELTPKQEKIREEINDLKDEYLLNFVEPEQERIEFDDELEKPLLEDSEIPKGNPFSKGKKKFKELFSRKNK